MKNTTITTLAALLIGSASAFAQDSAFTKPAGFVSHTLKAGQFNLVGLTLHQPVVVSGELDDVNGQVLGDDEVNFGTSLEAGKTYILEITEASDSTLVGTIQEVTVWNNNEMTTPQDLDAQGLVSGDKYQLRAAATISDVFGAANSAGLLPTDEFKADEADLIYVPNGAGFDTYFYSDLTGATGWFKSDFSPADNTPIPYMDSILILRRAATDLKLVVTGSVKTVAATLALGAGQFNYVSATFPVGSTLGNSGLEANLTATDEFKADEADIVYMPNGTGGYDTYFYSNLATAPGWFKSDFSPATNVEIKPGIIILRRGAAVNATVNPPSTYNNL
ncbi:hypothetical protein NT6N_11730 [Oceaniferula spumae]|uniref:Uncharacterized protein n=1 Tax=Oceaniferula spumae TaxID=2979115 RepID=A0AAT9FJJ5_9BACT